jgi:hypothetical protein
MYKFGRVLQPSYTPLRQSYYMGKFAFRSSVSARFAHQRIQFIALQRHLCGPGRLKHVFSISNFDFAGPFEGTFRERWESDFTYCPRLRCLSLDVFCCPHIRRCGSRTPMGKFDFRSSASARFAHQRIKSIATRRHLCGPGRLKNVFPHTSKHPNTPPQHHQHTP